MPTNAIDLTTLAALKAWLNIAGTSNDQQLQDIITAFSAYVLHITDRGNADGSIPTTSPFATPVAYDEYYDGTGNDRLPIRNWPITAVTLVNVQGVTVNASSSLTSPGYVIDQSKKYLVVRSGGSLPYPGYRGPGGYYGSQSFYAKSGWPLGTQNIEIQYTAGFAAIPFDLEMMARKICALNYKRTGWIGQRSQMLAQGAGSVSYSSDWAIDDTDKKTLFYYKAIAA